VHEAYLKLLAGAELSPENRTHFFALAARSMRQVLVDHARRKLAEKRGGDIQHRVDLEDHLALTRQQSEEILALHEALDELRQLGLRPLGKVLILKATEIELRGDAFSFPRTPGYPVC
jgi:DNA-directed RNA polymerase specialized sigma24 family protein